MRSTDLVATARRTLERFVLRWQLDVTFHEVRAHPGVETQRQRSDLAILPTTPALFALSPLVTLVAHQLGERARLTRRDIWYDQSLPIFADTLAAARRELRPNALIAPSPAQPDTVQIPRAPFERPTDTLAFAA